MRKRLDDIILVLVIIVFIGLIVLATLKSFKHTKPAKSVNNVSQSSVVEETSEEESVADIEPSEHSVIVVEEDVPIKNEKGVNNIEEERYDYYKEAVICAKVLYNEARIVENATEKANVVWTILNQADLLNKTIEEVATAPYHFAWDENAGTSYKGEDYIAFCQKIILHWAYGDDNGIFRTLPEGYIFFRGSGKTNHFTNDYEIFKSWKKDKTYKGEYDYYLGYLDENIL